MNCAALPENLIEAELFGHEAGSFTGAAKTRHGRFEEADGGTLVPRRAGDACRCPRRIGFCALSNMARSRASARRGRLPSMCASSRPPTRTFPRQVDKGRFRADLLDRLSFEVITLPPMRAREGDVPLLADHFGAPHGESSSTGRTGPASPRALSPRSKLIRGRATFGSCGTSSSARSTGMRIRSGESTKSSSTLSIRPGLRRRRRLSVLPRPWRRGERGRGRAPPPFTRRIRRRRLLNTSDFRGAVAEYERQLLEDALRRNRFNQRATAAALSLSYDQLRHALKRHKLQDSAA